MIILKFTWKGERTKKAKTILKKNKIGGITQPDPMTYYISVQFHRSAMSDPL